MTAKDLQKLLVYEAALQEIARKIDNQKSYETYLRSNGAAWHDIEGLHAVTYRKIVRIMNAMERQAADPPAVASNTVSQRVH